MKLKKGSLEAKRFMAKIRAKKKSTKKAPVKKISGIKQSNKLKKDLKAKKIRLVHGYETVKRKLSGVIKNKTILKEKNMKNKNFNITISGDKRKSLSKDAISELRSIAKAESIIWKRNSWATNELKMNNKIAEARYLLIEVILSNGYTSTPSGKLIKTTH